MIASTIRTTTMMPTIPMPPMAAINIPPFLPLHFSVAKTHIMPEVERIIRVTDKLVVVAKHPGTAAELSTHLRRCRSSNP
jgi:hypothetical protein